MGIILWKIITFLSISEFLRVKRILFSNTLSDGFFQFVFIIRHLRVIYRFDNMMSSFLS